MFDIGWPELMVIAIVTVVVIGPKELPRVLRTINGYMRKIRSVASDFQRSIDDLAREADLEDIRKKMGQPGDMQKNIADHIDPTGTMGASFAEIKASMNEKYMDQANQAPADSLAQGKVAEAAPASAEKQVEPAEQKAAEPKPEGITHG